MRQAASILEALMPKMNAYSLPVAEIRTKNGRIVARVF
ncbi:hypothetical protein PGTDC60_1853 [Porphyromonas gingivalis TDC60]|nr:hypothetical protein PGTDC60_1853 [Porphyromonas gingivalis TDC60]